MSLIAAIGMAGALSIYLPVLEGPDSEDRTSAVEALSKEGAGCVEKVTDLLWQAGWRGREGILDALERIGPASVPELMHVVRSHPRLDARRLAVLKLGDIGGIAARDSLEDLMDTDDRDIVLKALGKIGDLSSRSVVAPFLEDRQLDVRRRALITLATMVGIEEVDRIIDGLADAHHSVRYASASALEGMGKPACEPLLLRLDGMSDNARFQAIRILGDLKYSPALGYLTRQLNLGEWWIRAASAQALGKLDNEKAGLALQASLAGEKHPCVRARISLALEHHAR